MKHILFIFISFFILGSTSSIAQERKLKKANEEYNQLAYVDATKVYLEVAKSGYKSEELFEKLGDTYYFNANYTEAEKWYEALFSLTEESVKPIYYLRYSQSLKAVGKDDVSKKWFDKYALKANLTGKEFENADDYLQIINQNSDRYTIKNLDTNTEGIDFGAGYKDKDTYDYKKIVYATTDGIAKVSSRRRSTWDGLSFLNLYEATVNEDGSLSSPIKIEGDVNTKFHESSAVFTSDGKTMYFTRNNSSPKSKRSKKEQQYLKIYRAHWVNGAWGNIEDLSINGDNYSTAHPALNPSEDKLYFVSDVPQTIGQTDIFMATINKDGSLGKPVNLGEKINTKGRESFPYITKDNELYFSSDGHYGLGGYDVFYVKLKGNGYKGSLINVGKPINSSYDDFAFVIDHHKGFVSSNRAGGKGYDDIYSFIENKDIKELSKSKLFGVVTDANTKEPIANATISVLDKNNNEVTTIKTDAKGYYQALIERSKTHLVKVHKDKYDGDDVYFEKNLVEIEHNFELSKNVVEVTQGEDIAKLLNVVIYFDKDKYNIRNDAKVELEKIIAALKQNPSIKLDIRSYTDSRANDSYNMILSQKRNDATLQYIINRGINSNRLTGRGYGESQLTNNCSNGVPCDEKMHQANRRSEFIIKE